MEGSYLPEYSEYEAEFWIQCTNGFYLRPLKVVAPEPSPISGYSECTKKLAVLVFRVFLARGQTRV